jgi:hypothetical protein
MLLLSALASTACGTTKSVSLEQLNALKPDRAWVTSGDQSVVLVLYPHVVGDTLVGYLDGQEGQLPTAGVRQVTVRTVAPARTALLTAGIAAGLGAAFLAVRAVHSNEQVARVPDGDWDCNKHPTDPACRI